MERDEVHDDLGSVEAVTGDGLGASEAASSSTSCGSKRRKKDEDEAGAEGTTDEGRDRDPNDDSSKMAEEEEGARSETMTLDGERDIDVNPAVPEEEVRNQCRSK